MACSFVTFANDPQSDHPNALGKNYKTPSVELETTCPELGLHMKHIVNEKVMVVKHVRGLIVLLNIYNMEDIRDVPPFTWYSLSKAAEKFVNMGTPKPMTIVQMIHHPDNEEFHSLRGDESNRFTIYGE